VSEQEEVVLEIDDPVAVIRINRPEAMNSFHGGTLADLRRAFAAAEADPAVVGIVLTGTGERAFSAGLDAATLVDTFAGKMPDASGWSYDYPGDPDLSGLQHPFTYPMAVRKPVIAAVNGACAGGAIVLALACDLRFADARASFTTAFVKRGLTAEHGVSWLLPRVVGPSRALDLIWSSRRVDADEAYRIGLVDRVVPDGECVAAARSYIEGLAATCSPGAMMAAKRLVYRHLAESLDTAVAEADAAMLEALAAPDAVEGAMSFMERRPPAFERLSFDAPEEGWR